MRILNLIENTPGAEGCLFEHGLSYYIENGSRKILVDTGASDAFLINAQVLGVDPGKVEHLVLSHGHYDHAGGILAFAKHNSQAPIWMQKSALGAYYHKNGEIEKYIGIAPEIADLAQVRLLDGDAVISEGIEIFCGVTGRKLWPNGNLELKEFRDGKFVQDEFVHEQYLVLTEGDKRVLVSGCAHNGILNILEHFKRLYGTEPDAVFSGFHMRKKEGYTAEDMRIIRDIASELTGRKTVFYTGHCTGEEPYRVMKEIMGKQLVYVHSGDEVVL